MNGDALLTNHPRAVIRHDREDGIGPERLLCGTEKLAEGVIKMFTAFSRRRSSCGFSGIFPRG